MKNTGLSLHLYTNKEELLNAKNGVSTIVAWTKEQRPEDAIFHISVTMDACDILAKEVRINVSKIQEQLDSVGKMMGEAMGTELEKLFQKLSQM